MNQLNNASIKSTEATATTGFNAKDLAVGVINFQDEFSNLTQEQQVKLNRLIQQEVVKHLYVKQVEREVCNQRINLDEQLQQFYQVCSRTGSHQTLVSYRRSINKCIEFFNRSHLSLLDASSSDALNYLNYLRRTYSASNTIRSYIAGISCFYTHLSINFEHIKNIFTGIKLPSLVRPKDPLVMTSHELKLIIEHINKSNPVLGCLTEVLSQSGLRSGAFKQMTINSSGKFSTISKGRQYKGTLNNYCIQLLSKHFKITKNNTQPFTSVKSGTIQRLFKYYTNKLFKQGVIRDSYSLHDLRHYFAVSLYKSTKDVVQVQRALNHSNIAVTSNYLISLDYDNC